MKSARMYSPADKAKKALGKALTEEMSFYRRTPTTFYRICIPISQYVFLDGPSYIKFTEVGFMPMYIPDTTMYLNGARLSHYYPGGTRILNLHEDDDEQKAENWFETTKQMLKDDILPLLDTIREPKQLIRFLDNLDTRKTHFQIFPWQKVYIQAYTYAYLGKKSKAISKLKRFRINGGEYASHAAQDIDEVIELFSQPDFGTKEYFDNIIQLNCRKMKKDSKR